MLPELVVGLIICNLALMGGLFTAVAIMLHQNNLINIQLNDARHKLAENEKSIAYLSKTISSYDVVNLFANSLYGTSSQKKPTTSTSKVKDFPFAVIKNKEQESASSEVETSSKQDKE